MDVTVPGGQQYYVDPYGGLAYTQAHSAYIPPGITVGGIAAYQNGGFINLNSPFGWVACPPTSAAQNDGRWGLYLKTQKNAANLGGCTGVNLLVKHFNGGSAAWQYT